MLRLARRRTRALSCLAAALTALGATSVLLAGPAQADLVRSTETWVINELNLQPAWAVDQGQGVIVAVIDSGADGNVSDLTGQVRQGRNFTGVSTPPSDPDWGLHGTWMASLVAGHGHGPGDSDGILGSAPKSTVLSVRVITDGTDPNYAEYEQESASRGQHELAEAIDYAVAHGAGVISMSLGYSLQSRAVRSALQQAYDHNIVVVASAGNSGDTSVTANSSRAPYSFPADYPGVLAVAAVDANGQVSGFSSKNLSVQVAAPGVRVPAQGRNDGYWLVTGTSPACALTAGVVALIKSKYPSLTDSQVITAITSSTAVSTRPRGGWDPQIGFGVVDAAAALTAAGKLAGEGPPSAGFAAASHFGGGVAAIPAPPVAPRGPAGLILFCLLAIACLTVIGLATGRLFALRELRAAAAEERPAAGGWGTQSPADGKPGLADWPSSLLGPASPDAADRPPSVGPVPPPVSPAQPGERAVPDQQPPRLPFLPAPTARHAAPRPKWTGLGERRDDS
jgi:subtilisin family serine protease